MHLVSFRRAGDPRFGAMLAGEVLDLSRAGAALRTRARRPDPRLDAAARLPADATAFLGGGQAALDVARAVLELAGAGDLDELRDSGALLRLDHCRLLPPVPAPPKVLCVARNYPDHAAELGVRRPEIPVLFARYAQTLVGANEPVWLPRVSRQLDWEGELAVIIGRPARHVTAADALRVVAGYSLFNDLSVRDYQLRVSQYTAGKNFDATGAFGPALVTTDDVADPHNLDLVVTVNGEMVQSGNTSEMLFTIPELIAHISEWTTLRPGDVIATGTPAGVGHARKPARYLRPADIVQVASPPLGVLTNSVVEEPEPDSIR